MLRPMPDRSSSRALARNLPLYAAFVVLSRACFWAPIFFLYLNERFPLDRILALHAFYYAAAVILEVPSGYLSDRVSRKWTLGFAASASVVANALFLVGDARFEVFVVAHLFQAIFYSFMSGTDASFHYDTLHALDRQDEFAERESVMGRNGYTAAALSALAGGAAGMGELGYAYALSLLSAVVLLGIVWALREPPRQDDGFASSSFVFQLRECAGRMRSPLLAWIFAYVVLQVTLDHVPYEFAQPYAAAALGEKIGELRSTPLVTGLVAATIAVVGALAASRSARLGDRFGPVRTLIGVASVQTGLIALMGAVIHVWVLPVIAARSIQSAVGTVLVRSMVAPRVPQAQRATYLSLQSLAGTLGYSSLLVGLAWLTGGRSDDPDVLAFTLRCASAVGVIGVLLLAVASRRVEERA